MRAILINPVTQSIESHTIDVRLESLQAAVEGPIAWGTELKTGDVLYVNDEGLLKPSPAFFTLGGHRFAGRGLLVGPEDPLITDVISTVDQIASMVRFDVSVDLNKALTVKCTTFNSADEFFEYLNRQRETYRD